MKEKYLSLMLALKKISSIKSNDLVRFWKLATPLRVTFRA